MLRILRQLTPEEMRVVAVQCGARAGAAPEEIIRCLSRLCGVYVWGIFPAGSEEVLLDHVGRRLGMLPMTAASQRAYAHRERAIFACYVRQGWEAAGEERRRTVLDQALAAWDNSGLPCPALPEEGTASAAGPIHPTLEALLAQSTGCRALARAMENAPLPLPSTGSTSFPFPAPARVSNGHQAMYTVLLILWRARARRLRERRLQRVHLERQWRQIESLLAVRRRNLSSAPVGWETSPLSGLSLTAAAGLSAAIHTTLAAANPATLIPAAIIGAAGVIWSLSALATRSSPATDERLLRMHAQLQSFRLQLSQIEQEIQELESE